jgi:hypothetical protein
MIRTKGRRAEHRLWIGEASATHKAWEISTMYTDRELWMKGGVAEVLFRVPILLLGTLDLGLPIIYEEQRKITRLSTGQ